METGKISISDYENLLLLQCLGNFDLKSIGISSSYISLIDKDEVGRNDLEWHEIEPYLRFLGVNTSELWQANIDMSSYESQLNDINKTLPKTEMSLQSILERLEKILQTKSPFTLIQRISAENSSYPQKISEIQAKTENCLKTHIDNLQEISENLHDISLLYADGNQNTLQCNELELKQDIQILNRKCLEQSLENDLYNPTTLEALNIIKEELIKTLDEQSDLKSILSSRLARYESDPNLMKILNSYAETLSKIQAKQRDIDSLNS
ncbi:unnamed protein product [Blepharisma stoltei]|uniref:Uncharacterized protein n=1 Tax=Blepharisma stoltei TaxID=1481888 RepID=A0AAU9K8A5_9CILI|nr:unnamed protein product [Blepharisma stoltei]